MSQTLPIEFHLGPAKTGLTCEIRVLQMDGTTEVSTWTTTGISEIDATNAPGSYRALNIVANDAGGFVELRNQAGSVLLSTVPIDPAPATAAEITADMDANSTRLATIAADTNELQMDWADGGRLDVILDGRASQVSVDTVDTVADGIKAVTDNLPDSGALTTIDSNVDAILADTGTDGVVVASHTSAAKAEINAEADQALADYDAPTKAELDAAFTEIKGATWSTTDTLEAIRDRGDAAWTTATGFSTHTAADVWAVGTRTLTGFGTLIADIWASATRTLTAGTKDSEIDAIKAQTDQLAFTGGDVHATLDSETVTVGTNNDKTGYSLSVAGIQAIWDILTASLTTASSIGKLLVDNVNATISSRLPTSSYTAPDNATIASIQADTNDLQIQVGTAGAGLTAIGDTRLANLDATVSSRSTLTAVQVNVEVDQALTDYDAPTAAELTATQAAIMAAIAALNNLSSAEIDAALATYDASTKAELDAAQTAITNAIAALNNLSAAQVNAEVDTALADYDAPTNAELTTAQGVITAAITTAEGNIRGADNDTLKTLSDQLDSGTTASAIWEHPSRTLTSTAAATIAAVEGSTLNITRSVTYEATISGLNIPITWEKLYFTMDDNNDLGLSDSSARVQILVTVPADGGDGLQYLNGAAATAGQAALTVDQGAGTVDIVIEDEATQSLDCGAHKYDIKIVKSDGRTQVLTAGDANVVLTPTGAVS